MKTIIISLDEIVQQVSIPQRRFDKSNTLWKVFNTIQENIEHGNYKAPSNTKKGLIMRKVKPITSMGKKEIFNQKLWEQARNLVA